MHAAPLHVMRQRARSSSSGRACSLLLHRRALDFHPACYFPATAARVPPVASTRSARLGAPARRSPRASCSRDRHLPASTSAIPRTSVCPGRASRRDGTDHPSTTRPQAATIVFGDAQNRQHDGCGWAPRTGLFRGTQGFPWTGYRRPTGRTFLLRAITQLACGRHVELLSTLCGSHLHGKGSTVSSAWPTLSILDTVHPCALIRDSRSGPQRFDF